MVVLSECRVHTGAVVGSSKWELVLRFARSEVACKVLLSPLELFLESPETIRTEGRKYIVRT